MAARKSALGKGLEALIPDIGVSNSNDDGVVNININEIEANADQPRKKFDEEKLNQLADSIKNHGVVQPVIVKKEGNFYKLIAGERRWRAARIAGLKVIPAITREFTEKEIMEISLIENLQREDLTAIEEAVAYKRLMDEFNLTQEEIADRIGKSRSSIANILRLLTLDERVKQYIMDGVLTEGHGRAISNLVDKEIQYEISKRIIDENLNVRQTEKLLKKFTIKKVLFTNEAFLKQNPVFDDIRDQLKNKFGTKVNLIFKSRKGKIEIEFYNKDDLDRILNIINNN
ncbi:chromosome-partitioning protein Spo0J [Oxobacter pfennigii]|uniref:Chromosome-partitioning protein Spo0J n=1 Tax=Oxobacter pfennigii TaxID=36849 RepID=A0A0P8YTC5_9CLOT|nr:ParB/RepB/Spo0J family partition protein [Oxobacter pfennigii]KPU42945.1 chromosome-partitioning protein Spo0J [Oxobacter pfennigii]